jgi:hypothetical protein
MRGHNFARFNLLRGKRVQYPVANEVRQSRLIKMLKLASPAQRKMLTWRINAVRAGDQATGGIQPVPRRCKGYMAPVGGHTIAARGHSQDQVSIIHRHALACAVAAINLFG